MGVYGIQNNNLYLSYEYFDRIIKYIIPKIPSWYSTNLGCLQSALGVTYI